jgi:Fe-S-cluster containining protein
MSDRLSRIARKRIAASEYLTPDSVRLAPRAAGRMPLCEKCTDRCCVHKEPRSGILLSLSDVAHLIDSGMAHLIVGRFSFRRDPRGRILEDIDQMPRLAKQADGNCHFYDDSTGRCTGYGVRPTICRRFPYEVAYRPGSGKPFARFIPWASCPTTKIARDSPGILQMTRDAVMDENVSYEDVMLLPEALDELRRAGFGRFLPPPSECPKAVRRRAVAARLGSGARARAG